MSSLGMILVALLLLATVITWGTSYCMLCPILALIVTIMEFAQPYIANNHINDGDNGGTYK